MPPRTCIYSSRIRFSGLKLNSRRARPCRDRPQKMASFRKVREAFLSEEGELDETDPESCVRQFYRCRQLPVLRKALRHADQAWMEEFLEWGGLVAIFDALSALAKKRMHSVIDAIPQLECVECLKAVMNSPYGLEFMINSGSDKFVHKLVLGKSNHRL